MPPEFDAPATAQLVQQFAIVPKLKSAQMAAEFTPLDVTEPLMPRFFTTALLPVTWPKKP